MGLKDILNNYVQSFEDGGKTPSPKKRVSKEFLDWLGNYSSKPTFDYGNIEESSKLWKQRADSRGVNIEGIDLSTQEGIDKVAGLLQRKVYDENRNVAYDYALNMSPTKNGLTYLVDNKVFTPKELESYGLKVDKNGKPTRGADELKVPQDKQDAFIAEAKKRLDSEAFKGLKDKYTETNIVDNKGYYRLPDVEDVEFDSEEEKQKFITDNGLRDLGNGEYATNKNGAYARLFVKEPTKEVTGETTPTTATPTTNEEVEKKISPRTPLLNPDQRMALETGVDMGYLGKIEAPHFRKVNVSYEPQIAANYQAGMNALNQLKGASGMTGNAMIANIIGQTQTANNQAIGQVSAQNQNIDTQIERANEQAVATADQMNLELATNYNNQWLQADANKSMINRSLNKFNTELGVQDYKNNKMRNYIEDVMGIRVDDGISVKDTLDLNSMQKNMEAKKILSSNLATPDTEVNKKKKEDKKQKGGYIREYINSYFKK